MDGLLVCFRVFIISNFAAFNILGLPHLAQYFSRTVTQKETAGSE